MMKIERESGECVTRLRISGHIQSDHIASIRRALSGGCERRILDLSEVTLVDLSVVQFLIECEEEGSELEHCPSYVRQWMLRERAEGA